MDIQEAQAKKAELAARIEALIRKYEEETELAVSSIEVERIQAGTFSDPALTILGGVILEVTL